jgi:hypothetical protein
MEKAVNSAQEGMKGAAKDAQVATHKANEAVSDACSNACDSVNDAAKKVYAACTGAAKDARHKVE